MVRKILIVFRDPTRKGKSVEEIYHGLIKGFASTIEIESYYYDDSRSMFYNIRAIKRRKPFLVHVTSDVYYIVPFIRGVKTLITIHDLGRFKELKGIKKWMYRNIWIRIPVIYSDGVLAVSEYTKRDILNTVGHKLAEKIRIIYNPVPYSYHFIPQKFNKEKPVILAVGTGKNKNIETLIKAMYMLTCKLVIIGHLDKQQTELLRSLPVEWINFPELSQDDVRNEYIKCDMVYFVSLHEGFGMPVIEAQAIGRPVLVSRNASIPEVAGSGAFFIENPLDVSEVKQGIETIIQDDARRESLIVQGQENIARFEFGKTLEQYRVLYRELMMTA